MSARMYPAADTPGTPAETPATEQLPASHIPLLLIIGPPSVGKSSAARQVCRLLEDARIPFAYVDRDDFGVNGLLHEDPLVNLREMLDGRVAEGAQRLVVVWRIDSADELGRFREALPWADITVCRLRAETDELLNRIAATEESFQRLHLQTMALEMAPRLERQAPEDIVLGTDDASPYAVAVGAFKRWATAPR